MNLKEIKDNILFIMDNNIALENKGLKPYTVCLEGGHGIGKTAIVEEIAEERGIKFTKINLGAFEEVGDLTGFPIKKYAMLTPEGESISVAEASLDAHITAGYTLVAGSDPVMDFAIPSWVPQEKDGANLLLLDDYSRANPLLLQSTMELLDKGQLGTWKLPKNTQIILTSNPDNGEYTVSAMDNAQKTRFITFTADFDYKLLATHMEQVGVRDEFINFAMLYPEMFTPNQNNNQATGRTFMAFARCLESVPDLQAPLALERALDISAGIFDDEDNIIGSNFTLFIHNKLDKLITPEKLVHGKWKDVVKDLEKTIGDLDSSDYRADIAAAITFRLVNYTLIEFEKKGTNGTPFVDRILEIVNHDKTILAMDLVYALANRLFKKHATRVSKLLSDDKFKGMLLS